MASDAVYVSLPKLYGAYLVSDRLVLKNEQLKTGERLALGHLGSGIST